MACSATSAAGLREQFLLDPDLIFLNHGSFGACPKPVFAAYQAWQLELERNPVAFLGRRSAALLAESRAALAAFLGARAEDLVYVTNATSGVNTVARSLAFAPGDEILTTDHEYGACDNVWEFVCARSGARLVRAAILLPFRADEFADRVWAGVTDRTRLIFLSHITSATALIFPIEDVVRRARERGILTLIDGAHVPGQLPLDLTALGADFYTGNCHKWLCAPKGAAFLHARPEHHERLDASVVSWGYSADVTGHTGFAAYLGNTLLERRQQWQGTRDIASFLTVPAAIAFHREQIAPRLQAARELLLDTRQRVALRSGLAPVCAPDDVAQMAVMPVPYTDALQFKDRLYDDYRIEVPVTSHGEHLFVRLSAAAYTTRADCDALCDALDQLIAPL